MNNTVGAALVVGGGIAGIQASLDLADAGFRVYLLDESRSIGGTMTQLDKVFPTNDCSMCILAPKLVGVGRHPNIQLITWAKLEQVDGEAGNFKVKITKNPTYVDEKKCTGCGLCEKVCPVEVPNEFDERMSMRKAIYVPFPQAVPYRYSVDEENCSKCDLCKQACKPKAIDFGQKPEVLDLDVGAIILAPGFEEFDAKLKSMYGYGRHSNVVSSIEFERILNASESNGGRIARPSDGTVPGKIAFVQCVGSRDTLVGNSYCSSVCCMYAIKQSVTAIEHQKDVSCTIFFMDMRTSGKEFETYYNRATEEYGVKFVRSRVSSVHEISENQDLIVRHVVGETPEDEDFGLVVLSVGMKPPKRTEEIAKILGIKLNKHKFCATETFSPVETSRPGIFVCGAFAEPKDIPESIAQASGAAAKAGSIMASERGKLVFAKEHPSERDVTGEEPQIGVFVCHCGINIGGVVNVPEVVEYAKKLPNVIHAEHSLYACSQNTRKHIQEMIKKHNLNRVVVAACTPRTHEPLFRETVREAGLNIYLFEMANLRDQCSWVHMQEPREATEKSKDLVRAIVAKARLLKPLPKHAINIVPTALVIGGGLSGISASLELAKQGFDVHLVEREKELGGHARQIHYLLGSQDPQEKLQAIIAEVEANPKIQIHLNAVVSNIKGHIGNFKTTLRTEGACADSEIDHGVVIIATGAVEYKPKEYLYGTDKRVVTQHELEEKLAKGDFNAKMVTMIQCVGSRNQENPNCSRICCSQAVKNALKIKESSPESDVYVMYKDMRTFGFDEDYYREASEKGVAFIRYDDEHKPEVNRRSDKLTVTAWEPLLQTWIPVETDLLVLSVATLANPDNERLADLLNVPLTKDKFFLEAHMKLRPVDFATDGVFFCGLAHSPKFIDESISQACAAASRAAAVLSKSTLELEGNLANVNEDLCSGCTICESLCAFNAIEMTHDKERPVAKVIEALCKGCGVCGSSCPAKAITLGYFSNEQILAQTMAMLKEELSHD